MAKKVMYRKVDVAKRAGWQKGAPPHVGFWKIRCAGSGFRIFKGLDDEWSWWDGGIWSYVCTPKSIRADRWKYYFDSKHRPDSFEYCYYWPTDARVARINPETGECTGAGPCPYETDGKPWPFKNR